MNGTNVNRSAKEGAADRYRKKNENKEGGQEAPNQTQKRSEHPEDIPSNSDQQISFSISIPTKAKVKFKQTLLSVHLKPKPTKQGAG